MRMTGDPGLPEALSSPLSEMKNGVATLPGVLGGGSKSGQVVAGELGGPGPTLWTLWMTSP